MQTDLDNGMKTFALAVFSVALSFSALSQQKIMISDFASKSTYNPKTVSGINWMKDARYYSTLKENKIIKYNITTGDPVEVLLDGKGLTPQLTIDDYRIT